MAAKKKAASKKAARKATPKRLPSEPKQKANLTPKRAKPKAKTPAVAKKAKGRVAAVEPKPTAKLAPGPVAAALPAQSAVRPGLQKRPDAMPIGVVSVSDGDRLIEQSTFYAAEGRDEYVERWEMRGYTCRFTPWNGLS